MPAFEFDEWAGLARRDRAAFEEARAAVIAEFLADQPPARRERLQRLQWRIDRERERCPNALAACIRISEMMWQRFAGPDGLAESLDRARRGQPPSATGRRSARVLPFRRPG